MILTTTIRGRERTVLVERDAYALEPEDRAVVTFADGGPGLDLTDLEVAAIAEEADERAWVAAQAGALDRASMAAQAGDWP